MEPIEWNIDPEIIKLFGTFPIKYYGIFFVTGLLLGYEVVKHVYKSEHIPLKKLESLSTYLIIGILVGARLGHCLFYDLISITGNLSVVDGNMYQTHSLIVLGYLPWYPRHSNILIIVTTLIHVSVLIKVHCRKPKSKGSKM